MSRVDKFKYHVIQFLEETYKGTADFVCVPRSWIESHADDDNDPVVNVWYPDEDPEYIENRLRKRKKKSNQWKSFLSIIKYSTDSYEDAKTHMLKEINQEKNEGDQIQLSEDAEGKTSNSTGTTSSSATSDSDVLVEKMIDVMGWCVSSKSANTMTIKRKELQEPDDEAPNKRSRVTELDESDEQTAGPFKPANKYNEYNGNDSREENNNDYDYSEPLRGKSCPKRFKKVIQPSEYTVNNKDVYGERTNQKCCPKRFKNLILPPGSIADNPKEENITNDSLSPVKPQSSCKRAKQVVLPPDYDENDSKWTLNYRALQPGLVELMKGTGVFVRTVKLSQYQKLSKDGKEFARKLLTEIFTTSALRTCSWTGAKARAYDRNGTNIRPGLDRIARTVLLRYASDYAREQAWPYSNTPTILHSIRNKMQKMRQ